MKPFVWVTAFILAALFLAGAIFTAWDASRHADFLTNPESKIAVGWLVTGLIFVSLALRGWKAARRKPTARLGSNAKIDNGS